ncbi:MAG: malto-oligosyltrehalose synthase [Solirubrobacterales bacterium]|nr:malto-oligosyltrehalose synthase [Solirubrobacterales bacterium]
MSPADPSPAAELRATYRLQLTSSFGFASARSLIPYLRDLGISHFYLSPSFQARPGSTHGYDVIDPSRLSDALGGEEEFRRLSGEAANAGMGIILDIVPNHMAADEADRYWADPELRRRFFDVDEATGHYRRFFDIDDLAGLRQEDPEVFEATHVLAFALLREGLIDGLRVDHPDGLADPAGYLGRLAERGADRVWVEKILGSGEQLRDWPVSGTVGYEFLNDVCGLFIDPAGEGELTSLWRDVSGDGRSFAEVAFEAKLEQASGTFSREVKRLAGELDANDVPWVDDRSTNGTKFTDDLARALSSLPIYRTYIAAGRVEEADRQAIAHLAPEFQRLLLEGPPGFVTRFQQTTPAIMAKGVEDTAFYRYGRLLALNDVGGDPSRFGIDVEQFHAGCLERSRRFPLNLITTMTHDAKRSADVRARIGALAGLAEEWRARVARWFEITEDLRDAGAPDDVERYFIFQTLVGAWPIESERLETYMEKALREAKRNTSWVEQNQDWEEAVKRFCAALYTSRAFLNEFEPFAARVAAVGDRAALGQLALKLTAPGVPDIYQGDELGYRALVDPDNRRPVDWEWREAMLRRRMGGSPPTGETRKLFLILRLLGLRARRPETFLAGGYEPLEADPNLCAYMRGDDVFVAVTVRPETAGATLAAPRGRWRDVLRGDERSFSSTEPAHRVLATGGLAIYERLR